MRILFRAVLALLFVMVSVPVLAQEKPKLSARQVQIVQTLYDRNVSLAEGTDNQRRELTTKMIQQFICEFPSEGFTGKSADPGRPFSKDSIVKHDSGRLYAWDWQNGSTRKPMVHVGQAANDITGQHPIPLQCVNHLATAPPPVDPPSDGGGTGDGDETLAELYAEFQAFKLEVRAEWLKTEQRDERIFANVAANVAVIATSLEEHREEARQTRNRVFSWLGNWRNLVAIAGGVVGGVVTTR